jgi:hypothetical protein
MQQRTHGGIPAPELPATKARQGRWGIQVFTILAISLALVGLVWLALEFYGQAIDAGSTGNPGAVTQPQADPSTAQPAVEPTPESTP